MTPNQISKKIKALGTTPGEVADNLLALGVRGYRCSGMNCPISNYLKTLGAQKPTACSTEYGFTFDGRFRKNRSVRFTAPPAVGEFIRKFDNYGYPELVS